MRRFVLLAATTLLLAGCFPKKYVLLSPEDDYSDDPSLTIQVDTVQEVKGRTEVRTTIANKGDGPLAPGAADVVLLDADEKMMPLLVAPSETIDPGQEKSLLWAFDTSTAAKGSLEMRLALGGKKIWPIIFSADKPSDFKAAPAEQPPMGGPQGGRPPF